MEFAVTGCMDGASDLVGADGNLAARAAALISGAADATASHLQFRVWLDKRIPVAAGLGGGSADAAGVLRAGARLLARQGVEVDAGELIAMAAELGSDVPALLEVRAVRATGRGERVVPAATGPMHMTVVFVAPSLTGDVYAALLPAERRGGGRVERLAATLEAGLAPDSTLLGSALESAACRVSEELSAGIARLRAAVPEVLWHMTGSGGAFFCIAADHAQATSVAKDASSAGFVARACRTVR